MSNKDNTTATSLENIDTGHSRRPNDELDSVLQLISAQVGDAQDRQTELLTQLSERLARLELGAAAPSAIPEAEDTSSSAAADQSHDAKLTDEDSTPLADTVSENEAFDQAPALEASDDIEDAPGLTTEPAPVFRDQEATTPEFSGYEEQDLWADNAADLPDADAALDNDDIADVEVASAQSVEFATQDTVPDWGAPATADTPELARGNDLDNAADFASIDAAGQAHDDDDIPNNESATHTDFDAISTTPVVEPATTDDPWSGDDAERLMQVYETEMLTPPVESNEPSDTGDQPHQLQTPSVFEAAAPVVHNFAKPASVDADAEGRFIEITSRIEETLVQMRAEDPVNSLREGFVQFQEDLAGALEEMATHADIESLKVAQADIEELRVHSQNMQGQLSRIDTVEKQLEAIMDRLSDDRLVTLLASGTQDRSDVTEMAVVVGEYVAKQVAPMTNDTTHVDKRLDHLNDALTEFVLEQRASRDQQLDVLDTLQDAMIQVLDRVASTGAPTTALPQYADAARVAAPVVQQPRAADAANEAPPTAATEHVQAHAHGLTGGADQPVDQVDLEMMSTTAIEAATAATNRHDGFEPFSDDAASSVSALALAAAENEAQAAQVKQPVLPTPAAPAAQPPALTEPMPEAAPIEPISQEPAAPVLPQAQHIAPEEPTQPQVVDAPLEPQPGVSVARLRQEFIVEAQRAKAQTVAAAQAEPEQPEPKGMSLFGISLGGIAAAVKPKAVAASKPQIPPQTKAERKPAGLARKKVLTGAFIIMTAASGALFLIPRGDTSPPQMQGIERVVPQSLTTAPIVNTPDTGSQIGVADTGNDATDGEIIQPEHDRSEIHEPWSKTLGNLSAPNQPVVNNLPGIELQTSKRPMSPLAIERLNEQKSMAHWSLKLGDAVSKATTSSLLPEYQKTSQQVADAPVQKATLHTLKDAPPTMAKSARAAKLDLPPATVGPLSLRLAAAKGHPSAEFEVGSRLAAGKGTKQNFTEAVKWYNRSASRGFAQSQYRLGTFYERGLGVKKDLPRARIWYRRAAEQGNTKAMHNLAVLSAGRESNAPDYITAGQWFTKAAEHGLADSQFNLAVLLENGLGVKKDLKSAYKYYTLASQGGDKSALKRRDVIASKLSKDQIASVEKELKVWRRKSVDKMINDAFTAGQAWKSNASNSFVH